MPKFFLFLFGIFSLSILLAQNDSIANVRLNNGTIYHGKILYQKTKGFVVLEISKDSSKVLAWEDISKIEYDKGKAINKITTIPKKQLPLIIKDKGVYFHYISSFGYGRTYRGFPLFNIEADFIWGYKFSRYFSLGGGMGHHYYPETAFVGPLFMEIKASAFHKKMLPILYLRTGYAAISQATVVHAAFKAKQYVHIGLGYQENTARKFAWTYSIGLMKQWTYIKMTKVGTVLNPITGQSSTFNYEIDGNVILNRIVWNWGILF